MHTLLSSDGDLVVSNGYGQPVVGDFSTDKLIRVSTLPVGAGGVLGFAPDKSEVLVWNEGKLQRWRISDGTLIATLHEYPQQIKLATYGADPSPIAVLE